MTIPERSGPAELSLAAMGAVRLEERPLRDQPLSVRTFSRPYAPFHDTYQSYYHEALRRHCLATGGNFHLVELSRLPRLAKALRRAQDRGVYATMRLPALSGLSDRVADRLELPIATPTGTFQVSTGQYLVSTRRGTYRVCIDAADAPEVQSAELLEWSDVHFKTNFWAEVRYPDHVQPLPNADPLVLPRLAQLRALRGENKEFELCAVIRVWAGESTEHNIRVLEAIAGVTCSKFVLAVVFPDAPEYIHRRLRRAGIAASTGLPAKALWRVMSRSRINVIRLGVHYCVPWRLTGALASGACVVLDRPPLSVWPQPLLEGTNYLNLALQVTPSRSIAGDAEYDAVASRLADWLRQPELIQKVASANADYFDRILDPTSLGRYIARSIEAVPPARATS
jgi:hypothetical protein